MLSIAEFVPALAEKLGSVESDLQTRYRALREAGLVPKGTPGRGGSGAALADPEFAAKLFVALGAVGPANRAPVGLETLWMLRSRITLAQPIPMSKVEIASDFIHHTHDPTRPFVKIDPEIIDVDFGEWLRPIILENDEYPVVATLGTDGHENEIVAISGRWLGNSLIRLIELCRTETGRAWFLSGVGEFQFPRRMGRVCFLPALRVAFKGDARDRGAQWIDFSVIDDLTITASQEMEMAWGDTDDPLDTLVTESVNFGPRCFPDVGELLGPPAPVKTTTELMALDFFEFAHMKDRPASEIFADFIESYPEATLAEFQEAMAIAKRDADVDADLASKNKTDDEDPGDATT